MGNPPSPSHKAHDFDDSLIDHADRCWKAECDNAERISKERHLLLTVLIAFFGFGLFKMEWLQALVSRTPLSPPYGQVVAATIAVLLIVAAFCFMRALFSLDHKPAKKSASAYLSLPTRAYLPEGGIDQNAQKRLAFARTYRAYQQLQERNEEARLRLSDAWSLFATGMGIVVLVVVIYIAAKTWSIMGKDAGTDATISQKISAATQPDAR